MFAEQRENQLPLWMNLLVICSTVSLERSTDFIPLQRHFLRNDVALHCDHPLIFPDRMPICLDLFTQRVGPFFCLAHILPTRSREKRYGHDTAVVDQQRTGPCDDWPESLERREYRSCCAKPRLRMMLRMYPFISAFSLLKIHLFAVLLCRQHPDVNYEMNLRMAHFMWSGFATQFNPRPSQIPQTFPNHDVPRGPM